MKWRGRLLSGSSSALGVSVRMESVELIVIINEGYLMKEGKKERKKERISVVL